MIGAPRARNETPLFSSDSFASIGVPTGFSGLESHTRGLLHLDFGAAAPVARPLRGRVSRKPALGDRGLPATHSFYSPFPWGDWYQAGSALAPDPDNPVNPAGSSRCAPSEVAWICNGPHNNAPRKSEATRELVQFMPQLEVEAMVSSQPERVTDFVIEQVVLACKAVVVRRRTPNLIAPACSNLNNMACFHIYCNLAGLPLTIDFGENSSLFIRG